LLICGSHNQTTMMHRISSHLSAYDCYFTPFYSNGFLKILASNGFLNFTVMGNRIRKQTLDYLNANNLEIDPEGEKNDYDLVLTCSDLIVPRNIRNSKIVLVQEGMTDPENFMYRVVKKLKLPRYLASTSTTGLSGLYSYFCVASEGYKSLFTEKGADPSKIVVTGIPNFDNAIQYCNNNFPYRHFVLAATSDARETFKLENRKRFIQRALEIANGRKLIFKLHPNENFARARREIRKHAPGAIIFTSGNVNHMIANCDVLITKYSSVVYTGINLGKEVYSDFDIETLKQMSPVQNGGSSAMNIANVCKSLLREDFYNVRIKSVFKKRNLPERIFAFSSVLI